MIWSSAKCFVLQVPSEVSHADFWQRYFYRLHQLDQDEARKTALMKRAEVVQEQLEWDDGEPKRQFDDRDFKKWKFSLFGQKKKRTG